jgi:hypothetical protein
LQAAKQQCFALVVATYIGIIRKSGIFILVLSANKGEHLFFRESLLLYSQLYLTCFGQPFTDCWLLLADFFGEV